MDRKIGLGLFLMLIIVVIGGCAQQAPPQNQGPNDTSTPTDPPIEEPPIETQFDNKYVYTTNTSMDQEQFRTHCDQVGGTFNECGSICAPDADMCAQVCAFTCVLNVDDQEDPQDSQVPIKDEFESKIVYGTSSDVNESALRAHCAEQGGEFNTCGSVCPDDADTCIEVCAYTCEFLTPQEYFSQQLREKHIEEIGQPIEGFNPNMYMNVWPGLEPQDFDGVEAFEGTYVYTGSSLDFQEENGQMQTSAAGAITQAGMQTLLTNVEARLGIQVDTQADVDTILEELR